MSALANNNLPAASESSANANGNSSSNGNANAAGKDKDKEAKLGSKKKQHAVPKRVYTSLSESLMHGVQMAPLVRFSKREGVSRLSHSGKLSLKAVIGNVAVKIAQEIGKLRQKDEKSGSGHTITSHDLLTVFSNDPILKQRLVNNPNFGKKPKKAKRSKKNVAKSDAGAAAAAVAAKLDDSNIGQEKSSEDEKLDASSKAKDAALGEVDGEDEEMPAAPKRKKSRSRKTKASKTVEQNNDE